MDASDNIPKQQRSRLIGAQCPKCDYLVRVARGWLDVGPPICPVDMIPLVEVQPGTAMHTGYGRHGTRYTFRNLDTLTRRLGGTEWRLRHDGGVADEPIREIAVVRYVKDAGSWEVLDVVRVPAAAVFPAVEPVAADG